MYKKHLFVLAVIIVSSLALKFFMLFHFYSGGEYQVSASDTYAYVGPAKALLKSFDIINTYFYMRPPLYSSFVALIFFIFGESFKFVIAAQFFFSIVPVICFYFIGRWLFSPAIGLLAAFFVAFDSLLFAYNFLIMSESLFVVFLSITLTLGVSIILDQKKIDIKLFLFGLFFSLSALTRPLVYFMLFPLTIGLVFFLFRNKISVNKILFLMTIFLLPIVVLIGGWQVRNKVVLSHYRFNNIATTNAGIALFFPDIYWQYVKSHSNIYKLKSSEVYVTKKIGGLESLTLLLSNPISAASTMLNGFLHLMFDVNCSLLKFVEGKRYLSECSFFKSSSYDILHFNFEQAWAALKKMNTVAAIYLYGAFMINIFLYVFIMYSIIFLLFRRRVLNISRNTWLAHLFLFLTVAYFILISSNAVSFSRFRVPFQAILDVYAAAGIYYTLRCGIYAW